MIGPSLVRRVLTTGVLLGDLAIARSGGLARAGLTGDRPNGRAICVFGIKLPPVIPSRNIIVVSSAHKIKCIICVAVQCSMLV